MACLFILLFMRNPATKARGMFSEKEDIPMGKFLIDILAMIVAGVVVALIVRFFNV